MSATIYATAAVAGVAGLGAGLAGERIVAHYLGRPYRGIMVAGTGLAFAALGLRLGPSVQLAAFLYLGWAAVVLAVIDTGCKRLPDPITLPSYGIGAALLAVTIPAHGSSQFVHALIGMAALWGIYAVQYLLLPGAIGRGDVKLAGVLGLYLGWLGGPAWLLGLLAGYVLGGLVSVALLLARRATRKSEIPFGPFMIAGTALAVLVHG